MGNGVSGNNGPETQHRLIGNGLNGAAYVHSNNSSSHLNERRDSGSATLKIRLQDKENEINLLTQVLEETRIELKAKDTEIERLKGEIHKLKSVIDVKIHKDGKPDLLATIHEEAGMAGQESRNKKQGVSGESSQQGLSGSSDLLRHFDKNFRYICTIMTFIL